MVGYRIIQKILLDEHLIFMLILIVFSFIRLLSLAPSQRSNQVFIFHSSVYFLLPLFSQVYLFCILVWHIKGCLGVMALWFLIVFCVLKVLYLGLPCILAWGGVFLPCIRLLKLLLMFSVPILFCIFANGTVWSPSALLLLCYCWIGVWMTWILGFNLYYRWLGICCGSGAGDSGNWPILPYFKEIARHFPALGQGVPTWTGASSKGGFFSEVGGCWLSGFTGAFSWGGWRGYIAWIRPGHYFYLVLLCWD